MAHNLKKLSQLTRYYILTSTTAAGSGHPSSSLSAVELMATLFFIGHYHYDLNNPRYIFNDRFILSKGHASPILYSLYATAGVITEDELLKLRTLDSPLEGHPTPRLPYVDIATGSLGQGLSAGLGMAIGMKKKLSQQNDQKVRLPRAYVLLGDSEIAEGQIWEAAQLASYYQANNLIGLLDMNRLGQRGETMVGWDIQTYEKRFESFGWNTIVISQGNDLEQIQKAFEKMEELVATTQKPTMMIAQTKKGAGVSLLEDLDNWHGKALPKDTLDQAVQELGEIDKKITGTITKPAINATKSGNNTETSAIAPSSYEKGSLVATREAYGDALLAVAKVNPEIIALDAEVSNSTYSEKLKNMLPDQFLEMFIAEQNMVSTAAGISKIGFVPFVSTFAAFLTRTFDQIRMAQYSEANLKLVGSHVGVSIGQDGFSQMGLEDISMMRSILNSIIFYPSDAVSTYKIVEQMAVHRGISYLRTTREKTPVLYDNDEQFHIGGSKVLRQSDNDQVVVFTAGITVHEALKAYDHLKQEGIHIAVVDLYSLKPLDEEIVRTMANKVANVMVVEDHYPAGGIGEAVLTVLHNSTELQNKIKYKHLCVRKIPHSAQPQELLQLEEIDAQAITQSVKNMLQ